MKDGDVIQIAHVVRDIDKTMKYYWETFGIGPWDVYTFKPGTVRDQMVHGKPSDIVYLVAVTWRGDVQYELMQPVKGRSIYDECLETKGEGLHHIKLYYKDCQSALKKFKEKGVEVIQSGKIDEDEFYYLDTEKALGYVIEIGNNGAIRAPERRYPA
ncbi:MAG: VOC family protein [Spirochaetota bacterium]|jgi:4-hydroxyphenylpyruvate dioxygenase-like putative hemolysin|nr:methylmalonyl-CoA epimerase [Spirochaetaceae bacterium]